MSKNYSLGSAEYIYHFISSSTKKWREKTGNLSFAIMLFLWILPVTALLVECDVKDHSPYQVSLRVSMHVTHSLSTMTMRSSRMVNWLPIPVLGSIPASSDTAESEKRQLMSWSSVEYSTAVHRKTKKQQQQDLIMEILWVSEDEAREEDEVGVWEVVMVFSVQCLAHQPQGLLNVICNEKQVGSGRWHTLAIGRTVAFEVCLLFYFLSFTTRITYWHTESSCVTIVYRLYIGDARWTEKKSTK
jgi:hypothetical protein